MWIVSNFALKNGLKLKRAPEAVETVLRIDANTVILCGQLERQASFMWIIADRVVFSELSFSQTKYGKGLAINTNKLIIQGVNTFTSTLPANEFPASFTPSNISIAVHEVALFDVNASMHFSTTGADYKKDK